MIDHLQQRLGLLQAQTGGDVVQVQGVELDGPRGQCHDALQGASLQAELLYRTPFGQQVVAAAEDGGARQQHVAELPAAIADPSIRLGDAGIHIQSRAVDPVVVRQQGGQLLHLVRHPGARPETLHLLQGDHIRSAHLIGDTGEVVTVVFPQSEVDVVGNQIHGCLGHIGVWASGQPSPGSVLRPLCLQLGGAV